ASIPDQVGGKLFSPGPALALWRVVLPHVVAASRGLAARRRTFHEIVNRGSAGAGNSFAGIRSRRRCSLSAGQKRSMFQGLSTTATLGGRSPDEAFGTRRDPARARRLVGDRAAGSDRGPQGADEEERR